MKNIFTILFVIFMSCTILTAQDNKILCLYNNEGVEGEELIIDWGFSALIYYHDNIILFDSGKSSKILKHNANILGVDLREVDIAILSHNHLDHISGFEYLLKINPNVKMYLPDDYHLGGESEIDDEERNKKYRLGYRFQYADISFVKQNVEILPGVALIPTVATSTGTFSKYPPNEENPILWGLPEVSLSLMSNDNKWILIDGCSHSGVDEIVKATNDYKTNVTGVIGGFHLLSYSTKQISQIANQLKETLNVQWVAPTHCTGDSAQIIFKEMYKNDYKDFNIGSIITF